MNEIEHWRNFTHTWQSKSVLTRGTSATVTGPRGSFKTTRLIFAKKSDRAEAARRGLTCKRATGRAFQRNRGLRTRRARTNGRKRAGRYQPDDDCSGLALSRFPMEKTRKGARILSRRRSPVPGYLAPLPFAPWRLKAQDELPAFSNGKEKGRRQNSVLAPEGAG